MLEQLLYKVRIISVQGSTSVPVNELKLDSRAVKNSDCFIAIAGTAVDGHQYIDAAVNNGATSVICKTIPESISTGVTYIQVEDPSLALAQMSHTFFGEPSEKLTLVGLTGTNGKTTVATLLYQLFTELGFTCGLISTVEYRVGKDIFESTHTTPDSLQLNALLKKMLEAGCSHVFMECSSHAIEQKRIAGLHFRGGIFTNITHDHLDYHKTFDEYIRVKKSWFDSFPSSAFAITNTDDKRGSVMLQNCKGKKLTYSLKTLADFKGRILDNSLSGLHMTINDAEVHFKMIGEFNAYNLLAVYGAAMMLGQDKENVLLILSRLQGAEGRFDYQVSPVDKIVGIVDYAHTPDALLNVLATIKNLKQGPEKIITVVGCGGNRDKTKRPVMAEVACEYSDKVIFTSDNPRKEDAADIIRDMEAGVKITARKKYISIPDRKEAIKTAVSLSEKQDIVLVAGKGHEKYQDINGVKYPFDDKMILKEMFELLEK